jgi:hypothetical protein
MERYIVNVVPSEAEAFQLLVPMSSIAAVSDLAEEIKKRVTRLGVWPDVTDLRLHLGEAGGPIIDEADTLSDVIIDPKAETITATKSIKKTGPPLVAQVCSSGQPFSSPGKCALCSHNHRNRTVRIQVSQARIPSNCES